MQSNEISFCGDVVLDSNNMAFRDKAYILDQIYEKQICPNFYYDEFCFS